MIWVVWLGITAALGTSLRLMGRRDAAAAALVICAGLVGMQVIKLFLFGAAIWFGSALIWIVAAYRIRNFPGVALWLLSSGVCYLGGYLLKDHYSLGSISLFFADIAGLFSLITLLVGGWFGHVFRNIFHLNRLYFRGIRNYSFWRNIGFSDSGIGDNSDKKKEVQP